MKDEFVRSELLLGEGSLEKLSKCKVAVFGVGGVGGYVVEALARTGVGSFLLVDNDVVSESNLNRQIIALHSTIGKYKVDVFKERIQDINPDARVETKNCFYLPENADTIDLSQCDYIVDAVDTVTAKIEIIMRAKALGIKVISAMGAGNKLDPTRFVVTDIYKTSVCPLAKVMRHELKKRGIDSLKVVYSEEPPITTITPMSLANSSPIHNAEMDAAKSCEDNLPGNSPMQPSKTKRPPGSVAYVPSVAGLIAASEVIRDLLEE